jgi:hypothetical protein
MRRATVSMISYLLYISFIFIIAPGRLTFGEDLKKHAFQVDLDMKNWLEFN